MWRGPQGIVMQNPQREAILHQIQQAGTQQQGMQRIWQTSTSKSKANEDDNTRRRRRLLRRRGRGAEHIPSKLSQDGNGHAAPTHVNAPGEQTTIPGHGDTRHGMHKDNHLNKRRRQGGHTVEHRQQDNPKNSQRRKNDRPRTCTARSYSQRGKSSNQSNHITEHQGTDAT